MAAPAGASKAEGRVVLPDTVLPSRYEIRLTPDLERFVFDASERIFVQVHEAVNEIKLHARELHFNSVRFQPGAPQDGAEPAAIEAISITTDLQHHCATFTFGEVLPVGHGVLEIDFVGALNNQMAGFYRSSYTDIHGVKKTMASTQFESLDARRCFPCWDEPARKAIFALTLVVDKALTTFSNMPEKTVKLVNIGEKSLKEVTFMDSPKMSTYLVAILVGEFDFVQAKTEHGVLVRVYTPPGRSAAGAFPLDVAVKSLDLYDDFFGLPYPLPKLDMVAIPEFAMGAMENWGLVTYRECDLLVDLATASNQQKQRVCIVVTHELAHQWFGNLVTMAWWDDLWLNEGFASWCENYAADLIFPNYRIWDQFPADTLAAALRLDGLKNSHPIQVPICHAEEVEEVFDAISYCKGASVIRMAHRVLGHDAFKGGLQAYMKQHQYSNTETFHLWNAWATSSGKQVAELMSSWTEQMGHPLVEVKEFKIEGQVAKLRLEQSWFLASGEAAPDDRSWNIPLFFRTRAGPAEPALQMMTGRSFECSVPLSGKPDEEFVLINDGMVTPMRVAYTAEMRERLSKAVRAGVLPAISRVVPLLDMYALAKAGKLGMDELLRFLTSYVGEKDYLVWDAISIALLGIQKLLMGGASAEVYDRFLAFGKALVSSGWDAANLGWEPRPTDDHSSGLLRGLLIKLTARFAASPAVLAEAKRRFERYLADPVANAKDLPDEYRIPIFQLVLREGGDSEYARLMEVFEKLTTNVDQKHVLSSVGFANGGSKLEALRWAISGSLKLQDFFYVMLSVAASSKVGLDLMWTFLTDNFEAIHKMVKNASPSIMDSVIGASVNGHCSAAKAAEIEAFFEAHPLPLNKRTISQVLEEVRTNAAFLDRTLATDVAKTEFWDQLNGMLKS